MVDCGFIDPNDELRAALAMVRMAINEYVPVVGHGHSAREDAEMIAAAIQKLGQERDMLAQINPG